MNRRSFLGALAFLGAWFGVKPIQAQATRWRDLGDGVAYRWLDRDTHWTVGAYRGYFHETGHFVKAEVWSRELAKMYAGTMRLEADRLTDAQVATFRGQFTSRPWRCSQPRRP